MSEENTPVEETQEAEGTNLWDMSDEEFDKMEIPDFDEETTEQSEDATEKEADDTEDDVESEDEETQEETETEEEAEVEDETTEETVEEVTEETEIQEKPELDYKSEYEKLLTPFKANGRDIKVDSVEEAVQLMQMGANYNKKMGALKPNLKLMKMLENHDLLDEGKLSYLIDLSKHDKSAIAKLVKESGLDPLEAEDSTEYKPNTYTVGDNEVELGQILEDIQDTDSYAQTVDIISNKWDDSSKQVLAQNPALIKVINGQVSNGTYSKVMGEVDKQRMLGGLTGLSDIEAYRQVGESLQARGAFNRPNESTPPATVRKKATTTGTSDQKVKTKKKAAAPTRSKPAASKSVPDFNPLSLSDDELDKIDISKYV